jgi:hypothetical protein
LPDNLENIMPPSLGEVNQIGFMSRDIEQSMRYFIDAWGVGPWYVLRNMTMPMTYNGEATAPELTIAMANCGDLQFEIVQQHNDVPSLYRDSLAATPALHIQHMGVWTHDLAKTTEEALARGWKTIFETVPAGSTFVTHPSDPMVCIELSDRNPFKDGVRAAIRQAALDWDGSDPIREGVPS